MNNGRMVDCYLRRPSFLSLTFARIHHVRVAFITSKMNNIAHPALSLH